MRDYSITTAITSDNSTIVSANKHLTRKDLCGTEDEQQEQ